MLSNPQHERARAGGAGMVRAEGLHKNFGRLEVLRGIDLEVSRQEVVCIIGPSGSGKSTLLRCVNHLEKINSGRLWVDGVLVGYPRTLAHNRAQRCAPGRALVQSSRSHGITGSGGS